jgi:hypothetical protein
MLTYDWSKMSRVIRGERDKEITSVGEARVT